jgi:predicted alpha/beta-hydrolase family hydrolase
VTVGGLILFHGAGGDRDHPTFLALEEGLEVEVARIDFPYRRKGPGRRPPDRMPRLIEAVVEAVEEWSRHWGVDADQIVIGGRSMGGRAASMAIAEGLESKGLILLSYPLHPQGKPDKLRVDHFDRVRCPTLLIQGTRDPMGRPEELAPHLPRLAGPLQESWIEANHNPKGHDEHIVATVSRWLGELSARRR